MNPSRIEMLEKFIKEDPADPFNYYALAVEYQKNEPQKSAQLFEQLLQDHAGYLPVYYTAGMFYADQGNEQRALEILNRGIDLARKKTDQKTLGELQRAILNLEN